MSNVIEEIFYRIKREPVLIAAFFAALQALVDGSPWRAVASGLLGVLVRHFTSPAFETDAIVTAAYQIGAADGALAEFLKKNQAEPSEDNTET